MVYPRESEDTLDLIGPIYDTVLDANLWPEVLERLRQHLCFHNAMLGVLGLPQGKFILSAMVGVPPDYAAAVPRYGAAILDVWGGPGRLNDFALEEPVIHSQAAANTPFADNPYYREWVRPQGIADAVAITLARDRTTHGSLAFGQHEAAPPISQAQLGKLRLLAPHLRRAVIVSRLLEVTIEASTTFEAAVEATRCGVVMVEADLAIVYANAAAREMLDAADPIRRAGSRLALRREFVPGRLQSAVRAASGEESQLGRRGIAIPITLANGSAAAAHIMPLAQRRSARWQRGGATAAVFIAEAGGPGILPPEALALLYNLTPAEIRAFELVVAGRSTREAADLMGIAPSTFRTHLIAVFAKTDRHSRSELIQLARETALPN